MKIPFLNRLRKMEVVGMDVGAVGAKILRLHRGVGGAVSFNFWFYPGNFLENPDGEIPAFREFLKANHLADASVACNIEDPSLKIRRVDLPKMPEYDLREAVRWQIRDLVEGSVSDYAVRYSIIDESLGGETKRMSLVVYAVQKAAIMRRVNFLKKLSLDPVVVEPTSVSLLSAFDLLHGWQEGEFYGLIDLGETKSVFTAMGEGKLYFSRPLVGVSGRELRALLERELALSPEDSDQLRRELMEGQMTKSHFAPLKEPEGFLSTLYTQISLEAQRSIDAFYLMFHKEKIHQLFICGGGATLPGLSESLSKNLAVSTSLMDPSVKFQASPVPSHLYDVALGLALYPL